MKCKKGKTTLITMLTLAVLTLAACGGGGGEGGSLTNSDGTGSGGLTNSDGTSLTDSNGNGSDESTPNKNIDSPLAGALSVAWDAPTNVDGSALNDLAGYKIYYGTSSGNYTTVVDIGNNTSYTFAELNTGSWCFAVTTYNTAGDESDYSNEVCT